MEFAGEWKCYRGRSLQGNFNNLNNDTYKNDNIENENNINNTVEPLKVHTL